MTEQIAIRLVTTGEELDAEREAATAERYTLDDISPVALEPSGAPSDETLAASLPAPGLDEMRFVEPVTLVATITLATLAIRFANHWLRSKEAGVQIDLRTQPATVSRLAGTPSGFVVVLDANGNPSTVRAKYEKPEDLIPLLTEVFSAGRVA